MFPLQLLQGSWAMINFPYVELPLIIRKGKFGLHVNTILEILLALLNFEWVA